MKKSEMNFGNEKGGQASKNSILCLLLASLGGFKHTVTKILVNNLTETAKTSARTLPQCFTTAARVLLFILSYKTQTFNTQCTMQKMQEYILYMYMISQ